MSKVSQGTAFEKEVEQILQLRGYEVVRNNLVNGTQIDLHAVRNDLLDNVGFVVECSDRDNPIGVDLVKEKSAVMLSLQGGRVHYRLMFVARNGFTAKAKAFADSQASIILLTLNDLENLLVDLSPYVHWYINNYERSVGVFKEANLVSRYVDLSARDSKGVLISSIDHFVRKWLDNDDNNLLFLLGDYGAGKTSFSRQFVYKLLREKYIDKGKNRFTPILLNLREYRGGLDLKRVVVDSFANTYGVELRSFAAFERLCATGKIVLVLDGLDEMNDRSDSAAIVDSFNQIYLIASLSTKVLLTCRSNFFRSNGDVIKLLRQFSISIPVEEESRIVELPLKKQGEILYIERLSREQIQQFVEKRFGSKSIDMLATIGRIHDLSDLSSRPVLLDMILSTLPELENAKHRINSAALYQHYTDRWTDRDRWRATMPLPVRSGFCEMLAWAMHCADVSGIPSTFLEKVMVKSLQAMAQNPEQLQKFKNEVQTCSFLIRVADEFSFAHKSFGEFFVARKLVNDMLSGNIIKKPDTKEIEGARPADQTEQVMTSLFSEYYQTKGDIVLQAPFVGRSELGKTFYWDYFRNALNDRIRSTQAYVSMQASEFAQAWSFISSDCTIRSYLEGEIKAIFSKQWLLSFSEDVPISEEIATFALEHISNLGFSLEKVSDAVKDSHSLDVLCDILRLGNAPDWTKQNAAALKRFVLQGPNEHLKIASAALLAKNPPSVTPDFVNDARKSLPPEGWSYFLFELSTNGDKYVSILSGLSQDDTMSPVDKVICLYGLGGRLPSDEDHRKLNEIVIQLLLSDDEQQRFLAARICDSMALAERVSVFSKAFNQAESGPLKKSILSLLEQIGSSAEWKSLRALSAKETDPEIRLSLKRIEQLARDAESVKRDRSSWNRVRGNKAIRDSLWRSRR